MAQKIRDDSKKLQVIELLSTEEIEDWDFDWEKVEIIKTIGDTTTRLKAIEFLKDENSIAEVAQTFNIMRNFKNPRGICELLNISKNEEQYSLENIEQYVKQFEEVIGLTDEEKFERISDIQSEYLKTEIAKTIKNDEKKINIIKLLTSNWSKEIVARAIKEDNKKIEAIEFINDDCIKVNVIKTINDDSVKIKEIENTKDNFYKCEIAKTLKDEGEIIKVIEKIDNDYYRSYLAQTMKSDESKWRALDLLEYSGKRDVVLTMKNEDRKIDYAIKNFTIKDIESLYGMYEEKEIEGNPKLKNLELMLKELYKSNDSKKLEFIDNIDNGKIKIEIIEMIKSDNKRIEALEKLTPEQWREYRNTTENIEFLINNISSFIEKEGATNPKAESIIKELLEKNNFVVKNIDFRILDSKYVDLLGKDKINLISCYPKIQDNILSLDDKTCKIFSKCIDNYAQTMETEEWTVLAQYMLENISKGEYDELLNSITDLEKTSQEDIEILTQVLQSGNWCHITDISQVKNFDKIREEKCTKIMEDPETSIDGKKEAVVQKIFGLDFQYSKEIINKFGEDIENINDGDSKDFVRCLKLIDKIEDTAILKEIFENCKLLHTNKSVIERTLKNEYTKQFNEDLYVPNSNDLVEGEANIYEAGVDFKMIMTSVGAYVGYEGKNYKDDWNRPAISTQHFCASYIRNDMIGTAPISNICYGFSHMNEDSLMLSAPTDLCSTKDTFNSRALWGEKYYTPEQQINNTKRYNEMDFRRIQDGEKKQPDYILVFRKNGEIPNMDEAKNASEQWGEMPIVIIDVDKCLESEKEKVENMLGEYKRQPKSQLAAKIQQKIRNNRVTQKDFCDGIENNLQDNIIEDENMKQVTTENRVTEEELQENYKSISASDRKKEVITIRGIYKRMQEILRGDEHGEEKQ